METVEVILVSPTGSGRIPATLNLQSGVITYQEEGLTKYSHITSENMDGWSVVGREETKPVELIKEEIKEEVKEEIKTPAPKPAAKPKPSPTAKQSEKKKTKN